MSRETRPAPPPLEGNDQAAAAVGTVAWLIALIVLVLARNDLAASSRWWIWTAAAGAGLGVFALLYVPRLKRSRERLAVSRTQPPDETGPAGEPPEQIS